MPDRQYRILLLAEAANPEWTSVPLIGWSLSRALAKVADVHLVTQVRNRDAIVRAGLMEGRDFSVVDNERYASPIYKLSGLLRGGIGKGWTTVTALSSLAYYSFEFDTWRQFKSRLCAREFDLVHRITPVSPTHQSILAKRLAKLRIPFVVGPMNGGVPWPKNFIDRMHAEHEWLSYFRSLYKVMPAYRSTRRDSSAIIAGSKYTLAQMPHWAAAKSVYIPENGIDLDRFCSPRNRSTSLPLQVAFIGRLVPYKGADILVEAVADSLRSRQLELHIIGDGPQRPYLEELVSRLRIRSGIQFHGWIPHAEVHNTLRTCDIMVLPSIREFGGGAVVEAMALGVTPIVADYAGPSELVDDETGIRVPFHDRVTLTEGVRQAVGEVIHHPDMLERLGAAARRKVLAKLTWDAKALQILGVYRAVLSDSPNLNSLGYS